MLRERVVGVWRSRDMIVFLKFCVSGGVTAAFSYAVCTGLMSLGADTKVAGAAAYLSSVPLGFLLHKVFSFQSRNRVAGDAMRFIVVSGASAVLAGVTLEQATRLLGVSVLGALVVVALVVTPCNFIAMRAWVFMASRKA